MCAITPNRSATAKGTPQVGKASARPSGVERPGTARSSNAHKERAPVAAKLQKKGTTWSAIYNNPASTPSTWLCCCGPGTPSAGRQAAAGQMPKWLRRAARLGARQSGTAGRRIQPKVKPLAGKDAGASGSSGGGLNLITKNPLRKGV